MTNSRLSDLNTSFDNNSSMRTVNEIQSRMDRAKNIRFIRSQVNQRYNILKQSKTQINSDDEEEILEAIPKTPDINQRILKFR